MPSTISAELAQLARLAREGGLDLTQVSLRVKADLLMTMAHPPEEDLAAFGEMAPALIPLVDEATAVILARKLAGWRYTPPAALHALNARGSAVLAALLRYGMPVPETEIESLAQHGDTDIAAALAERADLTATATLILAGHADRAEDLALRANPNAPLPHAALDLLIERSRADAAYAPGLLARTDVTSADLAPLFLHAGPQRRTAILDALGSLDSLAPAERRPRLSPETFAGWLVTASDDPDGALGVIASHVGGDAALAEMLSRDHSRELTALTLIAAGASAEEATRFLIRLGDETAHSVDRVFALVGLMRATRPSVAQRLVTQVAGTPHHAASRRPRHQPAMDPSTTPARAGAAKTETPSLVGGVMRRLGLRREQG